MWDPAVYRSLLDRGKTWAALYLSYLECYIFTNFVLYLSLFTVDRDSVENKMKRLEAQYASFQVVSIVSRYGEDSVT